MILVTLGTQDKSFKRLLDTIEKAIEKGIIQDKVVVQAGYTKYESKHMELFDLIPVDEFESLMNDADLVITHGGVGSVLSALKRGKKIIAAPRLSKYKEHTNDHQLELIDAFAKEGYLLPLKDFSQFEKVYNKSKSFQPKKFESNQAHFTKVIEQEIEKEEHISWYNKYKEVLLYLFFGVCTTIVNILSFYILDLFHVNTYVNNTIAWILSVLFAYITNKLFVFESKGIKGKALVTEIGSFFVARIFSYVVDMAGLWLFFDIWHFNKMLVKILMNVVVIVLNYIASKLFIFKKKESKIYRKESID